MKAKISIYLFVGIIMLIASGLPARAEAKIHLISAQEVKKQWLARTPIPRKLAQHYYQEKERRDSFVAAIKSGQFDFEAEVVALRWNIKENQRVRDFEMADQTRQDLAVVMQAEEERRRTAALESIADSLKRLESRLQNIEYVLQRY